MSTAVYPAYAALVFGVLVALVLLIPFVAIQYRRRGGLTVGIVLLDFLVLLYLVALLTYTLLPLPERVPDFCTVHDASPQLVPGQFVSDIVRQADNRGSGLNAWLRNPALLQIAFNVALFVPLGMIVRYYTKRSILFTALVGLGVSLLIEVTQLTGDWFAYPCAYRLFDVDDLISNTSGALAGALLAPMLRLVPGQAPMDPGEPRPVSLLRRLLGMLCDWLVVTLGVGAFVFVYLVVVTDRAQLDDSVDSFVRLSAGPLILAAVQLVWTVVTGRTVGETIVRLEPRPPARITGRLVRWGTGIGGYAVVSAFQGAFVTPLLGVGVLVSVVLVVVTRHHRGLSYVLNHWELRDDRT